MPKIIASAPVLLVKDVIKSAAYYRDKLGFTDQKLYGEPPHFAMVSREGFTVMLAQAPADHTVVANWKIVDKMWNIYFWVDDVEAIYAEFQKSGAIIDYSLYVAPLAGKFGVDGALALDLFDLARDLGLQPIGLSFHVGSQCLKVANWVNAIQACGDVWREAIRRGHNMYFLDLGGGYPAGHYHTPSIPTIEEIGAAVMQAIVDYIPTAPGFMLVLEPGRGMVGESGKLVSTVVGQAQRGDQTWLYLDAGVFNGLMETYEGFPPVVELVSDSASQRAKRQYTLAGPSCDSCDVIARNIELPEIHIGERLLFHDTGAYTNEYAAAFNGFPVPELIALNVTCPVAEQIDVMGMTA